MVSESWACRWSRSVGVSGGVKLLSFSSSPSAPRQFATSTGHSVSDAGGASALVSAGVMYVADTMIDKSAVAFNAGAGGVMFVSNNDVFNAGLAFNTTGIISSANNNRVSSGGGTPNGTPIGIK